MHNTEFENGRQLILDNQQRLVPKWDREGFMVDDGTSASRKMAVLLET